MSTTVAPKHKNQIVSEWIEAQVVDLSGQIQASLSQTDGKPDAACRDLMFLLAGLIELVLKSDDITITPGPLTAEIMSNSH